MACSAARWSSSSGADCEARHPAARSDFTGWGTRGISLPVRFLLPLLISACLGTALHAQTTQKERSLYERIMKPDKDKTFDPSTEANIGGRTFQSKSARTKSYSTRGFFAGLFRTKEYSTKNAWDGDMKFTTKEANTKGRYDTRAADVKTAPTKDARESGKTAATRPLWDGQRQYLGPESKKLDQAVDPNKRIEWRGDLKPMTIEDVRELLNKNK